jgi:Domain of unknown function (DUF5668)
MKYRYNRSCSCPRCRTHGLMGPVMLITLGILFLLDQMGHAYWMQFDFTWPALLIVVGVVLLLTHTASMEGHVPREWPPAWQARDPRYPAQPYPGQQPPPGPPGYAGPPVVTPPPASTAGFITPGSPKNPDDRGGA